ncbi:MAG: SH3 domain-containing protein, partial [Candidatus Rifleibacteriota bacterium]
MAKKNWLAFLLMIGVLNLGPNLVFAQNNPFDESTTVSNPARTDDPFAVESASNAEQFEIDGSWVNVRSGPGTNNGVLKTLPRGTKGKKLEEKNGWIKIDFGNGLVGWVSSKYIAKSAGSGNTGTVTPPATESSYASKQIERWERHLGKDLLDFNRFPWYWRLNRAEKAFQKGDYESALELARASSGNPIEAAFMQAKCLAKLGQGDKAEKILKVLEKHLEDIVVQKKLDQISEPYINEPIVFKFGGFDDIDTYRRKK